MEMIRMRNRLIHAYFDVDLNIVWITSKNELPELANLIRTLLAD